jgi:hypothetical protein
MSGEYIKNSAILDFKQHGKHSIRDFFHNSQLHCKIFHLYQSCQVKIDVANIPVDVS